MLTCDPRIHFALNCGAVSCPPIAVYEGESLDEQLDIATEGFLEGNTIVDKEDTHFHYRCSSNGTKRTSGHLMREWLNGLPGEVQKNYLDK